MREVTADTAADYLRETGRVPAGRAIAARELGGGVSNVVIRVDVEGRAPLVLKQSRVRLRTQAEWISRLDRIWIEQEALGLLATLLPPGTVPEILFEDRENYLFAMACAPDDAVVWKARLLAGAADPAVARQAGTILATIHAGATGHPALAGPLAGTLVFDQLRIDPYYRRIAQVHPDLEPPLRALIASMACPPRATFVHGDFSPKNILVHARGLTLVDFETAHAGDPAFDLGFFLSHLILKAFRAAPRAEPYLELTRQFWEAYRRGAGDDPERVRRGIAHASACTLARIDGKSPVDYRDDLDPDAVRRLARAALRVEPIDWEAFLQLSVREMHGR
jgi:5-methylthioribose kinase